MAKSARRAGRGPSLGAVGTRARGAALRLLAIGLGGGDQGGDRVWHLRMRRAWPHHSPEANSARYQEQVAAEYLEQAGLRVLDRNWRCTDGEIEAAASEIASEAARLELQA
jgi:hypothetical protein